MPASLIIWPTGHPFIPPQVLSSSLLHLPYLLGNFYEIILDMSNYSAHFNSTTHTIS